MICSTRITDFAGRVTTRDHEAEGRRTSVIRPDLDGRGAPETFFTYDPINRRITKTVVIGGNPAAPEDVTYVIHDGERGERGNAGDYLALVFDGHGDLTNCYLHGPAVDQILADEQVDSLTAPGDLVWPLTGNNVGFAANRPGQTTAGVHGDVVVDWGNARRAGGKENRDAICMLSSWSAGSAPGDSIHHGE